MIVLSERKIQRVGNSSFAVSLPKPWVLSANLDKKGTVFFTELGDGSMLLSPSNFEVKKSLQNFSIKIEEHGSSLYQILFSAYYLGAETITVFSENDIGFEFRSQISDTVRYMSGTEIVFEEPKKIVINVLLDKSKVNVNNVLSRIGIIIQSSINICLDKINLQQIDRNEVEIDRLFHLASKIILLSLSDSKILQSSGIKHNSLVISYLFISKKLENIADEIERLALLVKKNNLAITDYDAKLEYIKKRMESIQFPVKKKQTSELIHTKKEKEEIEAQIMEMDNYPLRSALRFIYRLVYDIEEELVNLSFYNKLIDEKVV